MTDGCLMSLHDGPLPRLAEPVAVEYRRLELSDLEPLQALHNELFPIRYEADFFRKATLGLDGISAHAAVTHDARRLVGFITYRTCSVSDCEDKELLSTGLCGLSGAGRSAAYIMTLGVEQQLQRRGIAAALLLRVLADCKASLTTQLLYLHVIPHNDAALAFYARHDFQLLKRERDFYVIRGANAPVPGKEHYDALALGVFMNGGCSPATTYAALCGVRAFLMSGVRWCASWGGTQRAAAWRSLPQAGKAHA